MPNIIVHGLDEQRSDTVRELIGELLQDASYADEVITDWAGGTPTDLKGAEQPYLEIRATDPETLKDVERRLRPLDMDTELVQIGFADRPSKRLIADVLRLPAYADVPPRIKELLLTSCERTGLRRLGELTAIPHEKMVRSAFVHGAKLLAVRLLDDHGMERSWH